MCCFELKEALIDFFLSVKLRNDSSIYDITVEQLEAEKEQVRHLESLEILECIKTSVETLLFMKAEENSENSKLKY